MHIALTSPAATMSSREIAEVVESRHDSVKRTIERLAEKQVIRFTPLVETSHDGSGARPVEVFRVNKRDSLIVVAQLCPEFTARIVDRWQELEDRAAKPISPAELSRMEILRMALDSEEARVKAETQLAIAAPKAQFVGRYVETSGLKGFREVAKLLKANEARLREFLLDKGIMYRLGSALTAYQAHIDAGRFEVKTGASEGGHAFTRTMFTPKGVTWIAGEWAKHAIQHALSGAENEPGEAA